MKREGMMIPGENVQYQNDEEHEKIHAEAHDRGRDIFPGPFNGKLPQAKGNAGYERKNKPVHGGFSTISFMEKKPWGRGFNQQKKILSIYFHNFMKFISINYPIYFTV